MDELHRAATPLELLFDLTFVAAVAQLAGRLAHAITEGHAAEALGPFLMVFFAVWWAWMNFTWLASAYDCDDAAYRLAAFVQMGGVLVLAAGIGEAFDHGDFTAVAIGYLVMRVGLVSLWLRAAAQDTATRGTALRYAAGVAFLQALWLAWLAFPRSGAVVVFVVLVGLELLVPVWAERRVPTSWHPFHIAERYALFTIILLGEGVFAATTAVSAVVEDAAGRHLVAVSIAGLAVVGALWWAYFDEPAGAALQAHRRRSFVWGYGHYLLFAALAAVGAGLEVVVLAGGDHAPHADPRVVVGALAVPVAVALVMLDVLRIPSRGATSGVRLSTALALGALCVCVAVAVDVGATRGACFVAAVLVGVVAARAVRPAT